MRDELDLDSPTCECGKPADPRKHPPVWSLPMEHGRPCGRRALGQLAAGSSFLERQARPNAKFGHRRPPDASQFRLRSSSARAALS